MDTAPIPLHKLCLILTLDLTDVADASKLPSKDHAAAVKMAAEATKLWEPSDVFARSVVVDGEVDLAAAHAVPFDPVAKNGACA
jgi:hypothetical protein